MPRPSMKFHLGIAMALYCLPLPSVGQIVDFDPRFVIADEPPTKNCVGLIATPEGAEIWVDGTDIGLTTVDGDWNDVENDHERMLWMCDLASGLHRIVLRKPEYVNGMIYFDPSQMGSGGGWLSGQLCPIDRDKFKKSCFLEIRTVPMKPDLILIDGKDPSDYRLSCSPYPTTPWFFCLKPGTHALLIQATNVYDKTQTQVWDGNIETERNALTLVDMQFFHDDRYNKLPAPVVWVEQSFQPTHEVSEYATAPEPRPQETVPTDDSEGAYQAPSSVNADEVVSIIFLLLIFVVLPISLIGMIRQMMRRRRQQRSSPRLAPPSKPTPPAPSTSPLTHPDPDLEYIRRFLEEQRKGRS